MSLINDMLRDLDNRRKHEQQAKTFTEVPIAVKDKKSSGVLWWLMGSGLLGLGAVIWLLVWFFPLASQGIPKQMVATEDTIESQAGINQQSAEIESAPQLPTEQKVETIVLDSDAENRETAIESEKPVTKLLSLRVNASANSTTLLLNFSELPEYRLEEDDSSKDQSRLVISLSEVELDDNLEIPKLAGNLLERISLRPQQNRMQLLVDLGSHAEVGSYELKSNEESGFLLQVDIQQVAPLVAAVDKKPQDPKEVPVESTKRVGQKITEQDPEVSLNPSKSDESVHLSRSENRISLDKQAYEVGLEQLRQGNLAVAEKSFIETLNVNPTHVQARMKLIATLQQQNKKVQAQAQMKEGLAQTPRSLQLRKMYARLLLSKQHNLEAIEVLRAQPFPAVAQDLEYHALLAALLQETRQFNASAQIYANLLQLRPETALWWFGLAVSMDQTGDFEQARNAYRRALALPGLSADVQKYVQSRLQVL